MGLGPRVPEASLKSQRAKKSPPFINVEKTDSRSLAQGYLRPHSKVREQKKLLPPLSMSRRQTQGPWPKGTLGLTQKSESKKTSPPFVNVEKTGSRSLAQGYLRPHSKVREQKNFSPLCQCREDRLKVLGPRVP